MEWNGLGKDGIDGMARFHPPFDDHPGSRGQFPRPPFFPLSFRVQPNALSTPLLHPGQDPHVQRGGEMGTRTRSETGGHVGKDLGAKGQHGTGSSPLVSILGPWCHDPTAPIQLHPNPKGTHIHHAVQHPRHGRTDASRTPPSDPTRQCVPTRLALPGLQEDLLERMPFVPKTGRRKRKEELGQSSRVDGARRVRRVGLRVALHERRRSSLWKDGNDGSGRRDLPPS